MPSGNGPVLCVVGARPNYMKMAPLLRAIKSRPELPSAVLVHTGQHYDFDLNDRLFVDLGLPAPDVNLEVGSHVEVGLRSFDRSVPEEINRVLTDQIAALLYTTERSAHANLAREGIADDRVHFVGNLMIDSLLSALPKAVSAVDLFRQEGLNIKWASEKPGYAVITLHRPSNVDDAETLSSVVAILGEVAERMPVIWPIHRRSRANIEKFGFGGRLNGQRIACLPPQGYLEMVGLMRDAALVLTDSGVVQEETTALGILCLTMRPNTERPITVDQGTNTLVGAERSRILAVVDDVIRTGGKRGRIPEYWDGKAAPRIADQMAHWLALLDGANANQ